jgi:hypothetical protein
LLLERERAIERTQKNKLKILLPYKLYNSNINAPKVEFVQEGDRTTVE